MKKINAVKRVSAGLLFAGFVLSASGSAALAASCFAAPSTQVNADVSDVVREPSTLLNTFPKAGVSMTSQVRMLVGTSADTIDPILSLLPNASSKQKSAIGAGFARAAAVCAEKNPEYATLIRDKVKAANSAELQVAFLAASSEVNLASMSSGTTAVGGALSATTIASSVVASTATTGKAATTNASTSVANGATASSVSTSGAFATGNVASTSTSSTADQIASASNTGFSTATPVDFTSAAATPAGSASPF